MGRCGADVRIGISFPLRYVGHTHRRVKDCVILSKRRSLAPNPAGAMRSECPHRDLVPLLLCSLHPNSLLPSPPRFRLRCRSALLTQFGSARPLHALAQNDTAGPLGTKDSVILSKRRKPRTEPHRGDAERMSASGSRSPFGMSVIRTKRRAQKTLSS